jgi:hypothetical protein
MSRPTLSGSSRSAVLLGNDGDGSTLTLDFTTGQLDPRLTFTRAGNATFINSQGYVEYAGANLVLQSGDLSQNGVGQWTTRTNLTLTGWNGLSDPFGGSTAVKIIPNTTNATHNVGTADISLSIGIQYTVSVYVKAAGYSIVGLVTTNSNARAHFNLATQTSAGYGVTNTRTITDVGNGWYRITMSFTVANGPLVSLLIYAMNTATDPVANSFAGVSASTDGVLAWGAQINPGSPAQTYYPTTTTAYQAPRFDYDPITLAPRGLLIEGSATSLSRSSQNLTNATYWTLQTAYASTSATGGTAPDGTNTGNLFTEPSSNLQRSIYQSYSSAAGTYTFSVWLKAGSGSTRYMRLVVSSGASDFGYVTINMSTGAVQQAATVVGTATNASAVVSTEYTATGWRRCSLTVTLAASVNFVFLVPIDLASIDTPTTNYGRVSYLGDGSSFLIWGAQLEAGSGASSYIPTGASTVQRLADSCVMTGTNFSSWFAGATEGVLFTEFEKPRSQSGTIGHDHAAVGSRYASGSSFIIYSVGSLYYPTTLLWPTGGAIFPGGIASAIPSVSKQAGKWFGGNDATNFANGVQGTTTAGTGTLTPTMLSVGANSTTGTEATRDWLNSCVRRVKFWPVALPDSQIIALTT